MNTHPWPRASDLTDLAWQARERAVFRREVLRWLTQAVGCAGALFQDQGKDAAVAPESVHQLDPAALWELKTHWDLFAPQTLPLLERLEHEVVATDVDSLGGVARWRQTAFYQHVQRPRGLSHTLYASLRLPGASGASIIGLCRETYDPSFDDATQGRLRGLVPTLALCDLALGCVGTARAREALNDAQRNLVDFVCLGYTNRDIARALGLSVFTVRNRLAELYAQFGLASRAELAHRFGQPKPNSAS